MPHTAGGDRELAKTFKKSRPQLPASVTPPTTSNKLPTFVRSSISNTELDKFVMSARLLTASEGLYH